MSAPTLATPLDLLAAHADLPGAARVLDAENLSALLGRPVRLRRARIKPRSSVLVAFGPAAEAAGSMASPAGSIASAAGSMDDGAVGSAGWAMLVTSRDKLTGILRRAARSGAPVRELRPDPAEPFLLSGGLASDPRLGRTVARVLAAQPDPATARILSYNPARHLVLDLPTSEVLRISHRRLDDVLRVGQAWCALGAPTLALARWRDRPDVLVAARWGRGDLAALRHGPVATGAAEVVGASIARLHLTGVGERRLPAARTGGRVPAVVHTLRTLLPDQAELLSRLAAALDGALPRTDGATLVHGDLSPDQVLVGADPADPADPAAPAGGRPEIRIVDLDRSGLGAPGTDLGSWLAWCLVEDAPAIAESFLSGYASEHRPPSDRELAAWTARALLAGAVDPVRRFEPDWRDAIERRLGLAEELLTGRLRAGSTPASAAAAGAATAAGATAALDPGLPGLARVLAARPDGVVVTHRPGRRAVVRLPATAPVAADPAAHETYVKIVRPGRVTRLLRATDRAAVFNGPFRTPTVLAHDEDTVTFAAVLGWSLHDPQSFDDGTWRTAWRAALEAWRTATAPGSGEAWSLLGNGETNLLHGPGAEMSVLVTWRERAAAADPAGAALREQAVAIALDRLRTVPLPAAPSVVHRDLHDKQLLWHPRLGPGLLDVDTVTLGDPALDLGNLRAHAQWRERQGVWSPTRARVVREEIDGCARRAGLVPAHLAAYEIGAAARLTCVYAERNRWREEARDLAQHLLTSQPMSSTER